MLHQLIGYADQLDILDGPILSIKEAFNNRELAINNIVLKVKLMIQSRRERNRIENNLSTEDYIFEVVRNFTYMRR